MERLNLYQRRDFSALLTDTFQFFKQEFVPFMKSFAVIVLPFLLVLLLLFRNTFLTFMSFDPTSAMDDPFFLLGKMAIFMLLILFLNFWIYLFSLSYMRVYQNHYENNITERISINDVFQQMLKRAGQFFLWNLLYGILVGVGTMLCFFPGIYIAVALILGCGYVVLKEETATDGITHAWSLIKGKWWMTFGFMLVLGIIIGVVSTLFQIPYMLISIGATIAGSIPGPSVIVLTMVIAMLGQYTLTTISFLGVGIMFYSYSEEEEHPSLLNKISEIGETPGTTTPNL